MPDGTEGLGVDFKGNPVVDPTKNVLDLVDSAMRRQDDLRAAEGLRQDDLRQMEYRHVREIASLRAEYQAELRMAETARIDAIRAVDVGAVNRAAEVSATQASTLAAQVATSAETLRTQVAAAASAAQTALAAALEPIIKDIADLRRVQYEQVGQKAQIVEHRGSNTAAYALAGVVIAAFALIVTVYFATR